MAIRPEKINLFQVEGQYKYDDGTSEPAAQHKTLLLKDPDIVMLQGEITYTNYIGTDTRYTVKISQDQSVVARIQNFGLRSDTTYKVGQQVNVFWDAENSRILTE